MYCYVSFFSRFCLFFWNLTEEWKQSRATFCHSEASPRSPSSWSSKAEFSMRSLSRTKASKPMAMGVLAAIHYGPLGSNGLSDGVQITLGQYVF